MADEKEWHVFLKPVPKEKVFEVDIKGILDKFMQEEGGGGENKDANFQAAGLVIQGATHTWGRKVDVLHDQVIDAVSKLTDEDQENNDVSEAGQKRRKKKSGPDYKSILGQSDFTLGQLNEEDLDRREPQEEKRSLLPRLDPFFKDLLGKERGPELADIKTGEYVCHKNDLWCHRAKFNGDGYVYPGENEAHDPTVSGVDIDIHIDEEADLDSSNLMRQNLPHSNLASQEIPEPINEVDLSQPLEEMNLDPMSENQMDADDEIILQPNAPKPKYQFLGGFTLDDIDGVWPEGGEQHEVLCEEILNEKEANLKTLVSEASLVDGFLSKKLDVTAEGKMKFHPKTKFQCFKDRPKSIPARPIPEHGIKMTAKIWVSIIAKHEMRVSRSKSMRNRDAAKVKAYNKINREVFGKNFTRFVDQRARLDGITPVEVVTNEAASMTNHLTDPNFDYLNNIHDVVDDFVPDMPNDPVPEAEISDSAVPGADQGPESSADDEMSRYRELVGQGMKRLASHYKETETSVAVREWKRSIQPALEAEQGRPEFNIREEIRRIDGLIQPETDKFTFEKLIKDRPDYSHCRAFAAMLQMANEGKIRIHEPSADDIGTEAALGGFRLETIREREHVAGDDVPINGAQKRLRALSSPHSSQSPRAKRKQK